MSGLKMRERIARALLESESAGGMVWDEQPLATRGGFLRDADAVLAAMREPTPAMVKAGKEAFVSCGDYVVDSDEAWKLMIDAAMAK